MKFRMKKDALNYCKLTPLLRHEVVKTQYWSMDTWAYVECWTVVFIGRKFNGAER